MSNHLWVLDRGATPPRHVDLGNGRRMSLMMDTGYPHPLVFGTGMNAFRTTIQPTDFRPWITSLLAGFNVAVEWPLKGDGVIVITEDDRYRIKPNVVTMREFLQNVSRRFDVGIGARPRNGVWEFRVVERFHSKVRQEIEGGVRYGFEVPKTRKIRL